MVNFNNQMTHFCKRTSISTTKNQQYRGQEIAKKVSDSHPLVGHLKYTLSPDGERGTNAPTYPLLT